jgi:hypothetical protein
MEEEKGFKFCKFNSSIDFLNCKDINITSGLCDECEEGYFLTLGDSRCTKYQNCFQSVYGVCTECNLGFYLNKKRGNAKERNILLFFVKKL